MRNSDWMHVFVCSAAIWTLHYIFIMNDCQGRNKTHTQTSANCAEIRNHSLKFLFVVFFFDDMKRFVQMKIIFILRPFQNSRPNDCWQTLKTCQPEVSASLFAFSSCVIAILNIQSILWTIPFMMAFNWSAQKKRNFLLNARGIEWYFFLQIWHLKILAATKFLETKNEWKWS